MAKAVTPEPISKEEFKRLRKAFANREPGDRVAMFKTLADRIAPGWFEWHDWTNRMIDALCQYRFIAMPGCAGSSKTRNVSGFAALWWLCAPHDSSVIFCSTTAKLLRKQGWAEIKNFHDTIGGFGNFVDSRTTWQYVQGDDKHGIFGLAVADGDVNRAAARIQGIHTRRQMVIIDEAEAVSPGIWKACQNLYSYPIDSGGEFILVAPSNPRSRLSWFGRFSEPESGWSSVSVDTEEWVGKPQVDGSRTFVTRFDALKSPNIIEGKTISKHIPTKARVAAHMMALKAIGAENSPDHWAYQRAFPPPEGLARTVFTESLLEKHDGYGRHEFLGPQFTILGAFDPAYGGGDRPALRFAAMGEIAGKKLGIEWMEPIVLGIDSTDSDPVRYQLVHQVRRHCENVQYRGQTYQCLPENFGIDCTGDGGVADIAQQEWSPKIIRILFSAAPSDDPCSAEDERPASEVYSNKRVEMYYRTRTALMSGQLKGIDKDTASELCTIEELVEKKDGSAVRRISLQSKKEYKLKFDKSPDYSDCGVEISEVARIKGFRIVSVGLTAKRDIEIEAMANKAMSIYDESTYFQPDNDEYVEDAV